MPCASLRHITRRPTTLSIASIHLFVPIKTMLSPRMIASKKVVHVLDAAAYEAYTERRDPTVVAAVELGGIRSALVGPNVERGRT